jgi:hypothetical protein
LPGRSPSARAAALPADVLEREAQTTATLHALRQLLERSEAADADGQPHRSSNPVPSAGAAGAEHAPAAAMPHTADQARPRAGRGSTALVGGAVLVGVLAASAYVYLQRQAQPPGARSGEPVSGRGVPAATGILVDPARDERPPAGVDARPEAATPAPAVPAAKGGDTGTPAAAVASVPGGDRRPTGAAKEQAAASTPPAAVPRPRAGEAGQPFELQQPQIGPCTEAVAALGLCRPAPAERKE